MPICLVVMCGFAPAEMDEIVEYVESGTLLRVTHAFENADRQESRIPARGLLIVPDSQVATVCRRHPDGSRHVATEPRYCG
ncbi:MAG: hypothetical protein U0936_21135 [Planctomycetaceae bacterium]